MSVPYLQKYNWITNKPRRARQRGSVPVKRGKIKRKPRVHDKYKKSQHMWGIVQRDINKQRWIQNRAWKRKERKSERECRFSTHQSECLRVISYLPTGSISLIVLCILFLPLFLHLPHFHAAAAFYSVNVSGDCVCSVVCILWNETAKMMTRVWVWGRKRKRDSD